MGPVGTGEFIFIALLALVLFGPQKLPELARTFAKAMKEFRKAQSDLKATFDREMQNLERETGIKELAATTFQADSYNYDYSSYDSSYYDGTYDSSTTETSTTGASATLGAGAAPLQLEAAHGSVANGHLDATHSDYGSEYASSGYSSDYTSDYSAPPSNGHTEPGHPAASHETHGVATEKPVNS